MVWKNTTEETGKVYYTVGLAKIYFDKEDDRWKEAGSFSRDDLPLVSKVSGRAHTWIFQQS